MRTLVCALLVLLVACNKENPAAITPATIAGDWRIEATRDGIDSTNPDGWRPVQYTPYNDSYNIYCVYDSRVNQSYLSRLNCTYLDGTGGGVNVSNCTQTVLTRDTVWFQLTKYDISLLASNQFTWAETYSYSKSIDLRGKSCGNLVYIPAHDTSYNTRGTWAFDEPGRTITLDYSPGFSRIDYQSINRFQVTDFSEGHLVLKHLAANGSEYKLRKL